MPYTKTGKKKKNPSKEDWARYNARKKKKRKPKKK